MKRYELTDDEWARLAPLLPPQRQPTGRPALDHRTIINGILWILRSGAPWRDLPDRYGHWSTVYQRFRRWQQAGIWQRVFNRLQITADAQGTIDWEIHFVTAPSCVPTSTRPVQKGGPRHRSAWPLPRRSEHKTKYTLRWAGPAAGLYPPTGSSARKSRV